MKNNRFYIPECSTQIDSFITLFFMLTILLADLFNESIRQSLLSSKLCLLLTALNCMKLGYAGPICALKLTGMELVINMACGDCYGTVTEW